MLRLHHLIWMLFFVIPVVTQAQEIESSTITSSNAEWLIPLKTIGTGTPKALIWLPDNQRLAIQTTHGVWVLESQKAEGKLSLNTETGIYYPGLSNLVTNTTHTRLLALELITDLRPDQPTRANIWDIVRGSIVTPVTDMKNMVAISPDGQVVASIVEARIELYALETGRRVESIVAPADVTGLDFSPDGRFLVFNGRDRGIDWIIDPFISIYDLVNRITRTQIIGDDNTPIEVDFLPHFSADGSVIVFGSSTYFSQFWHFNPTDNTFVNVTDQYPSGGEPDPDGSITFANGQQFILSHNLPTSSYRAVPNTNQLEILLDGSTPQTLYFPVIRSLYFNPDENILYYESSELSGGEAQSFAGFKLEARPYPVEAYQQILTPDGQISVSLDGLSPNTVVITDFRKPDGVLFANDDAREVFISGNFERLVYHNSHRVEADPKTFVVDIATGKIIAELPALYAASLSYDGRLLIGYQRDHRGFELWNVDAATQLAELPTKSVNSQFDTYKTAISPNGLWVATYKHDDEMRLWDAQTHVSLVEIPLKQPTLAPSALRFSDDNQWLLLSVGRDSSTTDYDLWNVQDTFGKSFTQYEPSIHLRLAIKTGLAESVITATGETVAYRVEWYPGYTRLINIADGIELGKFSGFPWDGLHPPRYQLPHENVNLDGTLHVREHEDNIYDAETNRPLISLSTADGGQGISLKFSPDNRLVASLNADTLTLWGVPTPAPCPQVVPSGLQLGKRAVTTALTGPRDLRVRTYPNGIVSGSIPSGTMIDIVYGPICVSGLSWWGIQTIDGMQHGWSAEEVSADDPLFIPIDNP